MAVANPSSEEQVFYSKHLQPFAEKYKDRLVNVISLIQQLLQTSAISFEELRPLVAPAISEFLRALDSQKTPRESQLRRPETTRHLRELSRLTATHSGGREDFARFERRDAENRRSQRIEEISRLLSNATSSADLLDQLKSGLGIVLEADHYLVGNSNRDAVGRRHTQILTAIHRNLDGSGLLPEKKTLLKALLDAFTWTNMLMQYYDMWATGQQCKTERSADSMVPVFESQHASTVTQVRMTLHDVKTQLAQQGALENDAAVVVAALSTAITEAQTLLDEIEKSAVEHLAALHVEEDVEVIQVATPPKARPTRSAAPDSPRSATEAPKKTAPLWVRWLAGILAGLVLAFVIAVGVLAIVGSHGILTKPVIGAVMKVVQAFSVVKDALIAAGAAILATATLVAVAVSKYANKVYRAIRAQIKRATGHKVHASVDVTPAPAPESASGKAQERGRARSASDVPDWVRARARALSAGAAVPVPVGQTALSAFLDGDGDSGQVGAGNAFVLAPAPTQRVQRLQHPQQPLAPPVSPGT